MTNCINLNYHPSIHLSCGSIYNWCRIYHKNVVPRVF